MKNKLLGNDPKTLFIGGANERGEYTSPLSGRTASEDFFHLLEEFAKRRLKKKDSQDFNILFEIPEYVIQELADKIAIGIKAETTALYNKLKQDEVDAVYSTFNFNRDQIINLDYQEGAVNFCSELEKVVALQKKSFLNTSDTIYRSDIDPYYNTQQMSSVLSNSDELYSIFSKLYNLLGLTMLAHCNRKNAAVYFPRNQIFLEYINEIEARLIGFLDKGNKDLLKEALCYSMFNNSGLLQMYEKHTGQRMSEETRADILQKRLVRINAYPSVNNFSAFQLHEIDLSGDWVEHYKKILSMLDSLKHLKHVFNMLCKYLEFKETIAKDPDAEKSIELPEEYRFVLDYYE